jgi:hypothetical protein
MPQGWLTKRYGSFVRWTTIHVKVSPAAPMAAVDLLLALLEFERCTAQARFFLRALALDSFEEADIAHQDLAVCLAARALRARARRRDGRPACSGRR